MENNIKDRISLLKHDSRLLVEYKYNHPNDTDRIMFFKEKLLKKYNSYFSTNAYRSKISLFNSSLKRKEENYDKYLNTSKLVIANKIFEQEMGSYRKYCQLKKLFLDEEELFDKYFPFVIPLIDNPIIMNLYKIELFYKLCKEKGYDKKNKIEQEEKEFLLREEKYFELYDYSKFIISSYITEEKSFIFDDFLENLGINELTFNTCLDIINELDLSLYKKYLMVKKENIEKLYNYSIKELQNIVKGIETGYIEDKKEFNILEFYLHVPYKYNNKIPKYNEELQSININHRLSTNFKSRLKGLGKNLSIKESQILNNYINSINLPEKLNLLEDRNLYFNELYINDKKLTIKDSKKIIEYMKINKYPLIIPIYNELLRKYASNELVLNNEQKTIKKILIP